MRAATDPSVRLIGPAQVSRLSYQRTYTRNFYGLSTGGQPVWTYLDAISLNLYPVDTQPTSSGGTRLSVPEDSMGLLSIVRGYLAKDSVPSTMPIWNTEINYGLGRGTPARADLRRASGGQRDADLPAQRSTGGQARRVVRLRHGSAARRRHPGQHPPDRPDQPGGRRDDPGREALARVESWMHGTMVGTATQRPCATDAKGTYTCLIKYSTGVGRVYWNPFRTAGSPS